MTFRILRRSAPPNGVVEFDFGEPVSRFIIGLSYWRLSYPASGGDHWVKTARISTHEYIPGGGPDGLTNPRQDLERGIVRVRVKAELADASGNRLSEADSRVVLTCIAQRGVDSASFMRLGPVFSGTSTEGPEMGLPFLSGFEFCGDTDQRVERLRLGTSLGIRGEVVDGVATMTDGDRELTGSVDRSFVTSMNDTESLLVRPVDKHQGRGYFEYDFKKPIVDAALLIRELHVRFEDAHNVLSVGGGAEELNLVDRCRIASQNVRAFLRDASGNCEAEGSYVSFVLVGIPAMSAAG